MKIKSMEMCSKTAAESSITSLKPGVKRLSSKSPNPSSPSTDASAQDYRSDDEDTGLEGGQQLPLHSILTQILNNNQRSNSPTHQARISHNLLYKQALVRMQVEARNQKGTEANHLREMVGDVGATLFAPLNLEFLPFEEQQEEASLSHKESYHEMIPIPVEKPVTSLASVLTVATETDTYYHDSSDEEHHFPVQVETESLEDLQDCPRILTHSMMQQIYDEGLPERLQMHKWVRCFAIGRDGDSFISLLDLCSSFTNTLLVIQTTDGHVLGGFASEAWKAEDKDKKKRSKTYYGNGETFLFASHPNVPNEQHDDTKELTLFKWTGSNDYNQICDVEHKILAMGGVGDFGLIVQDNFFRGTTGRCGTFDNPPLVPGGTFEIESFEVYGLAPLIQSFSQLPYTTTS